MKKVQRATNGQLVQADVTGAGEWVAGRITEFDKTHITFQPTDGSEPIKMVRSEVYKGDSQVENTPPATDPNPVTDLTQDAEEFDHDVDLDGEDDEVEEVRIRPDHEKYESHPDQPTASGRASYDMGDKTAEELRGMHLDEVYAYTYRVLAACEVEYIGRGKKRTKVEPGALEQRYGGLNKGMQRMNLGNVIRGAKATVGQA